MAGRRFAPAIAAIFAIALAGPQLDAAARKPVRAKRGMVASTSEIASQHGVEVMRRGGNAIDAAVAVALTLAVTWPEAGNLGGGGFMMIRRADGTTEVIDYRETAPAAATRTMFAADPKKSVEGGLASGVPGTVAGLALALERHGTMKWGDLVEPARRTAAEGFEVNYALEQSLLDSEALPKLERFAESKRLFLRDGRYYRQGDRFVQPELAATLERLQKEGPREFYEGRTAKLIVDEMKRSGGIISADDLKSYRPVIRQPIRGTYRGHEIITMPLPSSGGPLLLHMLKVIEPFDLAAMGSGSAAHLHLMVETMKRAFADRSTYFGDGDFVEVPLRTFLSDEYAAKRRASIDLTRASRSTEVGAGNEPATESPSTTHFTIVDEQGNIVSNTYTINDSFGSGVTVAGAGFLLNDEMDDFASNPGQPNAYGLIQGERNRIEPRKRPLSSMAPTIVLTDGKPWLALGTPGGPTIINTVLQVILNVVDFEMNLQEAVDAPRVHHQWLPDEVKWERFGVNPDTRKALESMGHQFRATPNRFGDVQAIMIEPRTGVRIGAADSRLEGRAIGY